MSRRRHYYFAAMAQPGTRTSPLGECVAGNRASLEPVLFESLFPQGFPGSNPGGGVFF